MGHYRDIKNSIDTALEEGMERGLELGRAKGRAEVASTMLAKGMDIDTISELTGLSADEILTLK